MSLRALAKRYGTYAVVIALALAGGIALTRGGSDDDAERSARPEPATASPAGKKRTEAGSESKTRPRARTRPRAKTRRKRGPRTRAEALRRLSPKDRRKLVMHYALVALDAFDLHGARVQVPLGGRVVRATLPKRVACRAHADQAARLLRALRDTIPFPRTVTVAVAGSGEPLGSYLAKSCKRSPPRGGKGRTVLLKRGSHVLRTKPFRIRSKRWTIEYESNGTFFQIFVFKGKAPQPDVINETKPGSGKKTFRGPGKFTLNIAGANDWTVRVRDGV